MLDHSRELKANGAGVKAGRKWGRGGAGDNWPRWGGGGTHTAKAKERREKERRWRIGQMTNCD